MRSLYRMLIVATLCAAATRAQAQAALCDQLRAMTQEPAVAAAHWGISVVSAGRTPLCSIDDAQLFRPASTNKLFTTAAALALLGPDHRYHTDVIAEGTMAGGVLTGDLVLTGSGDPSFGSGDLPYVPPAGRTSGSVAEPAILANFEELAAQIAARGITSITGNIVGDDTRFSFPQIPVGWAQDDLLYGYGAPVSALTVHDNQVDLQIAPSRAQGQAGAAKAMIRTTPALPFYQVDNRVYQNGLYGGTCDSSLLFEREPSSQTLKVIGSIDPQPGLGCRQAIAIDEPARYAAQALREALLRHGVTVQGTAAARHADVGQLGSVPVGTPRQFDQLRSRFDMPHPEPVQCQVQVVAPPEGSPPEPPRTVLASHPSRPLLEELTFTNKVSENLHAELMMRTLGVERTCSSSQRDGLHEVREFLLYTGIDGQDIALYDGSGLSDHDLVTPRALTRLLTYAAGQPWFASWKATLPVGAVDGTLSARFTGALKGRVFAKTGTLGESRALAGYVKAASGQSVAFSILADTHLPSTTADRAVMDRMVEAIAAAD